MEVLLSRHKGTRILGRLPTGLRRRPQQLLDRARPLVHRTCQQEVVPQPRRRPHHRRHPRGHEPTVSSGRRRTREGNDTGLAFLEPTDAASSPDYNSYAVVCPRGDSSHLTVQRYATASRRKSWEISLKITRPSSPRSSSAPKAIRPSPAPTSSSVSPPVSEAFRSTLSRTGIRNSIVAFRSLGSPPWRRSSSQAAHLSRTFSAMRVSAIC